mmetsp:Transcript_59405/g.145900  ORF Transcript_59405/g.145900 Transcript_59405/m.145900 type:complete len:253 (+) Transcript_59405:585-1343(+)
MGVATCSPTGVAAFKMEGGRTVHSLFNFAIHKLNSETIVKSKEGGSITNKIEMFKQGQVGVVILDEVSMLCMEGMGNLKHMCRVVPCNLDVPFGGMMVISAWDFFQLPPISPSTPIYASLMKMFAYGEQAAIGQLEGSAQAGCAAFREFRLRSLTQQMREPNDPEHMHMIDSLQDPFKAHCPFDYRIMCDISSRILKRADVEADSSWATAPVTIGGNIERTSINLVQAKLLGLQLVVPVVVWKLPCSGLHVL